MRAAARGFKAEIYYHRGDLADALLCMKYGLGDSPKDPDLLNLALKIMEASEKRLRYFLSSDLDPWIYAPSGEDLIELDKLVEKFNELPDSEIAAESQMQMDKEDHDLGVYEYLIYDDAHTSLVKSGKKHLRQN